MKNSKTFYVKIYIAGNYLLIENLCADFCIDKSLCVNITKVNFIYKYGQENGVIVELIQYPKYHRDESVILNLAFNLAEKIRSSVNQKSYSIVTPHDTFWFDVTEHTSAVSLPQPSQAQKVGR